MGYLDALAASYFETTEDGQRLFFPWGVLGRGHAIPSKPEFDRLWREVKVYRLASPTLAFVGTGLLMLLLDPRN